MHAQIRANTGTPVQIVVRRDGQLQTITVKPVVTQRQVLDADGHVVTNPDGTPKIDAVGFLGLSPTQELQRQSPRVLPGLVWDAGASGGRRRRHPREDGQRRQSAVGDGTRDPNGPISLVGIGRVAGEAASAARRGVSRPWRPVRDPASLIASLNIALFVFNMHPAAAARRRARRGRALGEGCAGRSRGWRHRPDPGPVDIAKLLPVAYGVASLLIGMSVLLIYADIVNPIAFG